MPGPYHPNSRAANNEGWPIQKGEYKREQHDGKVSVWRDKTNVKFGSQSNISQVIPVSCDTELVDYSFVYQNPRM